MMKMVMTSQTQTTPQKTGYRKKPLWIYFAAVVFILTPLFNHLLSLAYLNVPRWYAPSVWTAWLQFISIESWIVSALIFSAGVCLFFVRKWSLGFALGTLIFIIVYSLVRFKIFWKMGPVFLLGSLVATGGAFSLLYFSRFRQPYLDPRIRWWETSTRYTVNIPVKFMDCKSEGILTDISRTGALVEWNDGENIPELSQEAIVVFQENLAIPCRVVRKTARGYGLAFLKLDSDEKKGLANFIKVLSTDPTKIRR